MHTALRPDADVGHHLDSSALRQPIDRRELRGFVAANEGMFGWSASRVLRLLRDAALIAVAAVVLAVVGVIALFFLLLVVAAPFTGELPIALLAGLLAAPLTAALTFLVTRLVLDAVRGSIGPRRDPRRTYRLAGFAADNGLVHAPRVREPRQPGTLFRSGVRRLSTDVLALPDGSFEMGNHRFGSGWLTERGLNRFGYIRVALPRAMPHLVLEARANRRGFGRSALPWQFRSRQRLTLEGDFAKHFTLVVPTGYERDALRLFTPDLMALLIDRVGTFDVEVVDDQLYVYSPRPLDLLAPATYQRALAILETIASPTARLAGRWRDDRTANGGLSIHGRRLRTAIPIGATLGCAYFIAVVLRWALFHG